MAAALGVHHSALSTCSSFKPSSSAPTPSIGVSRRRTVQCSCSRREEASVSATPAERSPRLMSRLIATGLALAVSTSSSLVLASESPLVNVANVAKSADKLLKDADKLTNDDSPPRFGPSRGGLPDTNSDKIAQQGGSGAIPSLQNPGSDLVGQARDKFSDKIETTKQRLDESVGKAQDKAEEAKSGVQGLFGQAQDKAGEAKSGLFGKAQGKAGEAKSGAEGLVGQAQDKADEAKSGAKGLFGQAQDKVKSNVDTATPGSGPGDVGDKVKGLVGDASNKAKSNVDTTKDKAQGFFGNVKKGLKVQ